MDTSDIFTLDATSNIHLSYLAEGAANIVYRPTPLPATPSTEADISIPIDQVDGALPATPPPTDIPPPFAIDPRLEGKLIRLRKNLPTTVPVAESLSHFHDVVSLLFLDNQLVSQTLFEIFPEVSGSLNDKLISMESDGTRAEKRHGVYIDTNEEYGTLVDDMSSDEKSLSIEFKPKWLVQSPSAPVSSKRCRTCALRAMKQAKTRARDGAAKDGFCPLGLVSADRSKISAVVEQLLSSSKYSDMDRMRMGDQLMRWIPKAPLLQRLKNLQQELDPIGVLNADFSSQDFLTAMTLRDCTLFLKIPRSCSGAIEARLGDLDLKSSRGEKGEYWRNTEQRLIDEGWYTCTEKGGRGRGLDNECFLAET